MMRRKRTDRPSRQPRVGGLESMGDEIAGNPRAPRARVEEIFQAQLTGVRTRSTRWLGAVLLLHWPAAVIVAATVTPRTWIGGTSSVHLHLWAALCIGALLSLPPAYAAWRCADRSASRMVIAIAFAVWSAFLIHLTGGRLETHFHVFAGLAAISLYRDVRVLLLATAIVAVDHLVRGIWWPQSVFGVAFENPYRWIEHALWVLSEVFFLAIASAWGLRELRQIAETHVDLEIDRDRVEARVQERTRELRAEKERAEQANAIKELFLQNMNHEVRTPMNAILGYTEHLASLDSTRPEERQIVADVQRNANRLLALVDNVLALTSDRGSGRTFGELDVAQNLRSSLAARVGALEPGGCIRLRVASLPALVRTDLRAWERIVGAVVDNAVKFCANGTIDIEASWREPSLLRVDVADTGEGFDPSASEAIFQVFVQGDSSSTRRYEGAGLGLSVARELARELGGEVSCVEAAIGRGSRFRIDLPVEVPEGAHWTEPYEGLIGANAEEEPPSGSSSSDRSTNAEVAAESPVPPDSTALPLTGRRVLVAEDGPDNQRILRFILKKAGARVDVVENGQLAVEAALGAESERDPFDIVLMDMQMPVMDGYSATRTLKDSSYPRPVLAVTAHALPEDRDRCLAAGCSEYLTKPVEKERLVSAILDLLPDASVHVH